MMPLVLTEEQEAIRGVFREFAEREVRPRARERDERAEFPAQLVGRLRDLNGWGITHPPEYGGLGLDTSTLLLVVEELAAADAALASIFTAHYLGAEALVLYGTQEQRTRYLVPLATGEHLGGFALSEPGAGSDIGSIQTRAVRDAEGWTLSGTKTFISNAREAGLLVLFARTAPGRGIDGIGAFALPTDTPGVEFSAPQDKAGIRSAPTYTVYLSDVRLPAYALIGEEGHGGRIALRVLNHARIDIAGMANGIAARALQLATRFATDRRQFDAPIREFQANQLALGRMDAELEVARLAAFRAAELKDAGEDVRRSGAIAKYVASEHCFQIVDAAVQIHGGMGFMREAEIERLYRDCRVLRIYEGTSDIQLLTIARSLLRHFDDTGETQV
jgi:alkylation response protein AidB-like acyl-CoA dehydrogenase